MKNFLLFISLLLAACSNGQEQPINTTNQETPKPTTTVTRQAPTQKEATAPPQKNVIRKPNYIVETSRNPKDINKSFPYDIDLKSAAGKTINSSEVLGKGDKPTVLLFWLTTCVPCRHEMAAISEKMEAWQAETDFNLVAISTDFQKNYESFVKRVNDSNWPFEAYNDVNREFRLVMPGALNGLPQTFILDKDGNIVYHKRKYKSGDEDTLYEQVKLIASR